MAVVRKALGDGRTVPLAGVRVTLAWRAEGTGALRFAEATSDEAGRVFAECPRPALLTAVAKGCLGARESVYPDSSLPVSLELDAHAQLSLRVLSPEGRPRAGTVVRVGYAQASAPARMLVHESELSGDYVELVTDDDGVALMDPVFATLPVVAVIFDPVYGRQTVEVDALLPAEKRAKVVRLDAGGALMLVIQDQMGRGLPGAQVTAFKQDGDTWRSSGKAVTGQDGIALLNGLGQGHYDIVASGWNPSSTDLYLLSKYTDIVAGVTSDLGTLAAAPPFSELELTIQGEDDVGSRLAKTFISKSYAKEDRWAEGTSPRDSIYECLLPMGRPVRVWTGYDGDWRYSMSVLKPNKPLLDSSIEARVETVPAPGSAAVVFALRAGKEEAVVSGNVTGVRSADAELAELKGFLCLMKEGACIDLITGMDLAADLPFAFSSPVEGPHRLVGCLGGRLVERDVPLQPGEHVRLGDVATVPAGACSLTAFWPDGTAVADADVSAYLDCGASRLARVPLVEARCDAGTTRLRLVPALDYVIVYRDGARSGRARLAVTGGEQFGSLRLEAP